MNFVEYKEKIGSCSFCGNSPVPHIPTFVFQTFNIFVGLVYQRLVSLKMYRVITLGIRYVFSWVQRMHYPLAMYIGVLKFSDVLEKATTYRSQVIWEEAQKRGIPMQQMIVFGRAVDVYRMLLKGHWWYFESIPLPYWLDQSDYAWMDDKYLLKERLAKHATPVPRCVSVTTEKQAISAFKTFSGPVVVKPRIGSRARHTTVNVSTEKELLIAFHCAQQLCFNVVIEEYLLGSVCRATTVGGVLRGFLRGEAPFVIGNGMDTIEQLVAKKNAVRPERVAEITLTADHDSHMRRQGYSRSSIPNKDVVVSLNLHTGRLFGGETEEYGEAIHPSIKSAIESAAKALSAPLIGFDIILQDPLTEPRKGSWGIIEANTLPFIDLHYLPLKGYPSPIAKYIFNLWE